jgi:hypothetical protein
MKLRDFIFCDDVRAERGNKISLMGLYSDKIVFEFPHGITPKWPQPIRLSVCFRMEVAQNDLLPDEANLKLILDGNLLLEVGIRLDAKINQALVFIPILLPAVPLKPGQLGFEFILRKGEKEIFKRVEISALKIEERELAH